LYKAEVFVPEKWNLNLESAQKNLEPFANNARKYLNEKNYIMAVMECLYAYYNLYYSNYVEKNVSDEINTALEMAGGKGWEEAAPLLAKGIQNIMSGVFTAKS
jgi:hypothetical protein